MTDQFHNKFDNNLLSKGIHYIAKTHRHKSEHQHIEGLL